MECIPIKKIAKFCHEVYQSVLEAGAYIQCTVDNKITYNNFEAHGDKAIWYLNRIHHRNRNVLAAHEPALPFSAQVRQISKFTVWKGRWQRASSVRFHF